MSPFNTCPDCGAVLYMGSRCWNCSPPQVVQSEEVPERQPAFDLPESYRKHLQQMFGGW